ncbi:MaoC/PaaZ C-terminal domain-containing protein [Falsibacillus albus]|uniref:3-hydroxyacyl-ACP dehydratase n=1 Tax=Falsibacillus albus TaxID=2478915 RepID=A0A3L7JYV3_9BACI|nr:MaoC/PaaZ C-terminal domain-containing protein [Falsibacillus albus]RLQ95454.1 3-hydroxyacyl-ACP dehydratase [Falsibacillus albus]
MKQELPNINKPVITHSQLVKYAGASGDFNPIHTVVPVAKEAGLKDCIAHGMLVMGMAGQALGTWFPRESLRGFKVRFQKMTYPGEVLTVKGRLIEGELDKDGLGLSRGEISVENEEGEVKLSGSFNVLQK